MQSIKGEMVDCNLTQFLNKRTKSPSTVNLYSISAGGLFCFCRVMMMLNFVEFIIVVELLKTKNSKRF